MMTSCPALRSPDAASSPNPEPQPDMRILFFVILFSLAWLATFTFPSQLPVAEHLEFELRRWTLPARGSEIVLHFSPIDLVVRQHISQGSSRTARKWIGRRSTRLKCRRH